MSQEQSNTTMMPAADVTMVLDGEDEAIMDLGAITREVKVKLDKDLVEAKAWNDGIMWKKQEWANQLAVANKKRRTRKRWRCRERWTRTPRQRAQCSLW